MRIRHVGHLTDYRRDPKTDTYCVICQRDIKGEPKHWVHLVNGGVEVLHPQDETLYKTDGGDLYFHPVGPECAKKIGKEWVHSDPKGA